MTKCIVLLPKEAERKPIEFNFYNVGENWEKPKGINIPATFKNVELVSKGFTDQHDLMFAYDKDRSMGTIYLGHWNDGIV